MVYQPQVTARTPRGKAILTTQLVIIKLMSELDINGDLCKNTVQIPFYDLVILT